MEKPGRGFTPHHETPGWKSGDEVFNIQKGDRQKPRTSVRGAGFTSSSLENLAKVFSKHKINYLIIGKSGAIVYGFPDTTQDIDIFPEKSPENARRMIAALKELGFKLDEKLEKAIGQGKDFIQIRGEPFDMDLVFAPDGIDSFDDAKKRATYVQGKYPVASIDDIIKSKRVASRQKDKEVLDRLEAFRKYLKGRK